MYRPAREFSRDPLQPDFHAKYIFEQGQRLARQAIQKQSENRSGKPHADELANTIHEALEINSLMWKMALPREVREINNYNVLQSGLGKKCLIASQLVSGSPPKPVVHRSRRPPLNRGP